MSFLWIKIGFSAEPSTKDIQQSLQNFPIWLSEKGDCYRAQSESLRYHFSTDQKEKIPHPSLIACQFHAGNYQKVINIAEDFLLENRSKSKKLPLPVEYLLTFSYLKLGQDQKAKESWSRYVDMKQKDPILLDQEIPGRINPDNARIYSMILPGAGFLTSQSYGKAALAFLLNGIFISGTHQAYQNHQFGLASLLLFFEIGWYKGGINAAEEAAINYNNQVVQNFREQWIKKKLQVLSQTTTSVNKAF